MLINRTTIGLVTLTVMLSIATATSETASSAADKATGKATVYSDTFNGKKTATGEKYKSHELSGASNKLPLGSKVLVKNKKTGKQAVVKINDRMGKNSTAAVDLSKGAAAKIGVKGTAPVEATVIQKGK